MSTSPQRLGKYELHERLGQGGIGEVWKAFDPQLQRYFAIKVLQIDLQKDPEFVTRFNRVARAIASLQHPNIVPVHDLQVSRIPGSNNVIAYIVMDYIEGPTLGEYLRNTSSAGKIPAPATIVRLIASISAAIDYAHQHGISHRDIKPTNILLDKHNTARNPMGEPMLTDFGLVEMVTPHSTPEVNAKLLNPLYISPEQAQGYPGTERSDIYTLGVILYEVCTGRHPYKGDNPPVIMQQHISATPIPPALYQPNIPAALTMVILDSLTKDPASRFPSASSMTTALAEALNLPVPVISSISDYTVDPMNSPTYITGTPMEGIRFETTRQQGAAASAGTPFPGSQAALYQSNPLPAVTPPGATPSSPQVGLSTPPFATSANAGPSTPMPPTGTGAVGSGSWGSPQGNSAPNLPVMPSAPINPLAASLPSTTPPFVTPLTAPKSRRKGLLIASIVALIIVLAGAGLGTFYILNRNNAATTASPTVGHAYFFSSGLLSPDSKQGITDQLQIKLENISPPQAGKSYYAWLLNDKNLDYRPIFLGPLPVNNGTLDLFYPGDALHSNLLATNSRFLITEEDAAVTPTNPSLDPATWRYYAEFSQTPNPADPKHFSLYDHIRHLLAEDPNLKAAGLTGGLDIWLYRNTQKILEWAGSARDFWKFKDAAFIHRQLTRIMDYLDGAVYVQKDLPGQGLLVDPTIARVALLTFDPQNQVPPGYLYHIGKHLHQIATFPDTSAEQRALAIQINQAIDTVNLWLQTIRDDVLKLYHMSDAQLFGNDGLSLLNSVATLANTAFVGQINPNAQVTDGVVQIHYNIQRLATFDIRGCTASDPCAL